MVYACYVSLYFCLHTVFPGYPATTSFVSNTHQQTGYTPLYVASEKGNSKTVDLLLQYKATPDKATKVTKYFHNHYTIVWFMHAMFICVFVYIQNV